jgi:hypothetical protein
LFVFQVKELTRKNLEPRGAASAVEAAMAMDEMTCEKRIIGAAVYGKALEN